MSEEAVNRDIKIGLLGATFDTGNMGVSALAESVIKCILHKWPNPEVIMLDSGQIIEEEYFRIGNKDLRITKLPIRFCRNLFLKNHFVVLCFYALLFKVIHGEKFRRMCTNRNKALKHITQLNVVADITGGDSFSDIYGMRRFIITFLRKWLVLLFNNDLVMLPQTYGPFKRPLTRILARYIFKRAKMIYSRDRAGVKYVNSLLDGFGERKVKFSPDVAFILDERAPKYLDIEPSSNLRAHCPIVVGLNVSGLLFNGGYNRNNMFSLKCNYQDLILTVIETLLQNSKVSLLLIPHVFPPEGLEVEDDANACFLIYKRLRHKYADRIFLVKGKYNQCEIKYIIGLCDFLIGSRMHACIAALSQGIPAAGLAYSKKFQGVFDSIGLNACVVDAGIMNKEDFLMSIKHIFTNRNEIREHLKNVIPKVQEKILSILNF